MKKLLFTTAIAAMAIVGNAAVVSWSIDDAYDKAGTALGGSYYAFFVATSGNDTTGNAVATYALASAAQDLANGSAAFVDTYAIGDAAQFDNGSAAGDVSGFGASQTVTGYLVVLNSDTVANATLGILIDKNDEGDSLSTYISTAGGSDTFLFGSLDYTKDSDNWHTLSAAPEPTSGLLLLLGVAGLALKRKQA